MIQQIINETKELQTSAHARDASEPLQHKQPSRVAVAQSQILLNSAHARDASEQLQHKQPSRVAVAQ